MKRKLQDNINRVRQRMRDACARAGRREDGVQLVVVTKSVTLDVIRQLVEMGVTDLGESRPQELERRAAATREWLTRQISNPASTVNEHTRPRWHQIGHLQRNKVKLVLPWVDMIHSVDTLRLAEDISAQSERAETVTPILLEVNAADDPGKHGVKVAAAIHMAEMLSTLKHVRLRGLMAMAPLTEDSGAIRFVFDRARELFDEIRGEGIGGADFNQLSMGMSHDFEHAIEAGATLIRVGSAIFEGIVQPPPPFNPPEPSEVPRKC